MPEKATRDPRRLIPPGNYVRLQARNTIECECSQRFSGGDEPWIANAILAGERVPGFEVAPARPPGNGTSHERERSLLRKEEKNGRVVRFSRPAIDLQQLRQAPVGPASFNLSLRFYSLFFESFSAQPC